MGVEEFSASRDSHLIQTLADNLKHSLTRPVVESLASYVALVTIWNRTIDLVAAKNAEILVEILLADALILASLDLTTSRSHIVDIGAGAGAPTIPLLLMRPDLNALLIEPKQKRVAFLHMAIGNLQMMERIQVHQHRIDPKKPRFTTQRFDVALSRATFPPQVWVEVGTTLAYRTLVLTAAAPPPQTPQGTRLTASHSYRLPYSGAQRQISMYESNM